MADVKIYKLEDLTKMSREDRLELLRSTEISLGHQELRVRTNEDKKSHTIGELKKQVARINTLNNQKATDEK